MNEKMTILNMLQDGKITADEASRLLAAVEDKSSGESRRATTDRPAEGRGRPATSDSGGVSNDGRRVSGDRPSSGVDFDELGRKFAAFAKDMEPKFQKATEIVAEKTVTIADKISDTISRTIDSMESSSSPGGSGSGSRPGASGTTGRYGTGAMTDGTELNVELVVASGYNELSLAGLNAEVQIRGYNGDKISAKIRYKTSRRGASIDLMQLGNKYYLNYEEDDFQFVAIDAYVPSDKFKIININNINGNVDVSTLECDELQIAGENGQTTLSDLYVENIKSESSNGFLSARGIRAKTAVLEHFNGIAEIKDVDVEKLSVSNTNGPLVMKLSDFSRYNDYLWNVETSNAKLTLNVPTLPDLGYHIRAHTSLGDIKIGLSGMEFITNDQSLAEARTMGFDQRDKKVRLALETSNAPITVN